MRAHVLPPSPSLLESRMASQQSPATPFKVNYGIARRRSGCCNSRRPQLHHSTNRMPTSKAVPLKDTLKKGRNIDLQISCEAPKRQLGATLRVSLQCRALERTKSNTPCRSPPPEICGLRPLARSGKADYNSPLSSRVKPEFADRGSLSRLIGFGDDDAALLITRRQGKWKREFAFATPVGGRVNGSVRVRDERSSYILRERSNSSI